MPLELAESVCILAVEDINRLWAHLLSQLAGRLHDFNLRLEGSGLVLEGQARSYHARQLAQHAVMRATALPVLRNGIEVI